MRARSQAEIGRIGWDLALLLVLALASRLLASGAASTGALAGAASALLLYAGARFWAGRWPALLAGAIVAVAPWHVAAARSEGVWLLLAFATAIAGTEWLLRRPGALSALVAGIALGACALLPARGISLLGMLVVLVLSWRQGLLSAGRAGRAGAGLIIFALGVVALSPSQPPQQPPAVRPEALALAGALVLAGAAVCLRRSTVPPAWVGFGLGASAHLLVPGAGWAGPALLMVAPLALAWLAGHLIEARSWQRGAVQYAALGLGVLITLSAGVVGPSGPVAPRGGPAIQPIKATPAPTPVGLSANLPRKPLTGLAVQAFDGEVHDLAVWPDGRIFALDSSQKRVAVLGPDLKLQTAYALSDAGEPWALARRSDGGFYVLDAEKQVVLAFGAEGQAEGTLPTESFYHPRGIAVGPEGEIYVADTGRNRVVVLQPNGATRAVLGEGVLDQPTSLLLRPTGDLVVAEPMARRVTVLSRAGALKSRWPASENDTRDAPRLAALSDGRILLGDGNAGRLIALGPTGTATVYGERGDSPGSLGVVTALATTPAGEILVAEKSPGRLQKLAPIAASLTPGATTTALPPARGPVR